MSRSCVGREEVSALPVATRIVVYSREDGNHYLDYELSVSLDIESDSGAASLSKVQLKILQHVLDVKYIGGALRARGREHKRGHRSRGRASPVIVFGVLDIQ